MKKKLDCSFCGREQKEVEMLIAGPTGAHICDICATSANQILEEQGLTLSEFLPKTKTAKLVKPHKIKEYLDQYIIGQDRAKKAISVSVYNHYKRLNNIMGKNDVELEKSNILLLGPTGTGKTLLARSLATFLEVPFTIADATVLTEAGYVGEDVENILVRLLQNAEYDVSAAERGIIFIDEIDKISRRSANASITRDVSGEGVQQGLLKILEGTEAQVPPKGGRKHPEQPLVKINTRNILFIVSGAFEGMEKLISKRLTQKSIGFNADIASKIENKGELLKLVEADDLLSYGLIPELIGRLPSVATFEELDDVALKSILTEPKNAIVKQFHKLFEIEGIKLEFTNSALLSIVEKAKKSGTGARGLRRVMETVMLEIMYEIPSKKNVEKVIISKEVVVNQAEPKVIYRKKSA